jgi:hypothetical protein
MSRYLIVFLSILACKTPPLNKRTYSYDDIILFNPNEQTEFYHCSEDSHQFGQLVVGRIVAYDNFIPAEEEYYRYEVEIQCLNIGKLQVLVRQKDIQVSCQVSIKANNQDKYSYCSILDSLKK